MNYWKSKDSLSKTAHEWTRIVNDKYESDIKRCIKNTQIFNPGDKPAIKLSNKKEGIINVVDTTTSDAIFSQSLLLKNNITALNFASYKNPGGGFLKGSSAQEESLCHYSILYSVLKEFDDSFYSRNRKDLNFGLYQNAALYTPDVVFISDFDEYESIHETRANVITCAAPNTGTILRYKRNNLTIRDCVSSMISRICFILDIAAAYSTDVLILGAFGCGVFQNDPLHVATIFKVMLENEYKHFFDKIIFAVPIFNGDDSTFNTFNNVIFLNKIEEGVAKLTKDFIENKRKGGTS